MSPDLEVPAACYSPCAAVGPQGGQLFDSTRLSAAEWYPDGQHGGVVSALITRAVERLPSPTRMEVARITVELFRVIPVTRLEIVTEPVREGKRIQTTEVRVFAEQTELARGLVQRLRVTDLGFPPDLGGSVACPPGPDGLAVENLRAVMPFRPGGPVTFGRRAVEIRQARGSFGEPGPAMVWFRFSVPLVAGEEMSPTQRAVLAADFSNGLSRLTDARQYVFMNSDLSVHLARPPTGEWVGLDGESIWHRGGRGVATSHLFDEQGAIGRATQTLFLDRGPKAGT